MIYYVSSAFLFLSVFTLLLAFRSFARPVNRVVMTRQQEWL